MIKICAYNKKSKVCTGRILKFMKKNCSVGSDELNSSCRIPSTLKTIQIAGFVEFLPFMD